MSPSRRNRRASPAWEGRPTITVATLPGRGLYARHLGHPEGVDAVHRVTVGPLGTGGSRAAFEPAWLAANLHRVDVVHVHGVHPQRRPAEIAAAAELVRRSGTPLVVTAYHLSDPTGPDSTRYAELMDALIPRADAVVTLTDTAAAELERRWGVSAQVVPHPHVVDFIRMRRRYPRSADCLEITSHLANLRLPVDAVDFVRALTHAVAELSRATLRLHVHESVQDPGSASYAPGQVREIERLAAAAGASLRVHRPFTEPQLWDHLATVGVSVVPGLFGSHSIWPEAGVDLGTRVVLPEGTHAAAQQPCLTFDTRDLSETLAKALWLAQENPDVPRSDPEQRWAQRVRVAEDLRRLYERLLGLDRR